MALHASARAEFRLDALGMLDIYSPSLLRVAKLVAHVFDDWACFRRCVRDPFERFRQRDGQVENELTEQDVAPQFVSDGCPSLSTGLEDQTKSCSQRSRSLLESSLPAPSARQFESHSATTMQ